MGYRVRLDFNRNGLFDHPAADVSARVVELAWDNGLIDPDTRVARGNQCRVLLNNSDGAFSDDDVTSAFYNLVRKGILVEVAWVSSGATQLFIGKMTGKMLMSRAFMPEVELTFITPLESLYDQTIDVPLTRDVTTDEALMLIWQAGQAIWPYDGAYFVIDYDEIDGPAIIYDVETHKNTDFEVSANQIVWVGDVDGGRGRVVSVRQYIDDLMTAEGGGLFYFDGRTGDYVFRDRLWIAIQSVIKATLDTSDDAFIDAQITRDERLINQVELIYYPREVSDSQATLWSLERPQRIRAGAARNISARYRREDDDQVQVAAVRVDSPLLGEDWAASLTETGLNGAESNLSVTLETWDARRATVRVANTGAEDVWIVRLSLRGEALYTLSPETITKTDAQSLHDYDLQPGGTISARLVSDAEQAEMMAMTYIVQRARPRTAYERVTVQYDVNDSGLGSALGVGVGDLVRVVDALMPHDETYVVMGEQHNVSSMQGTATISYVLRRKDIESYFVIDQSEIDGPDLIF